MDFIGDMIMRKEFVVMRIDAAPDGAPYVLVTLSLAKDMAEGNQPPNPSTTNVMGFSNMDDMMKNLNKMIAGGGMPGMMGGAAPGTTSTQTRYARIQTIRLVCWG